MHDHESDQDAEEEEHEHGVLHELDVLRVEAGVESVAPPEGVVVVHELPVGAHGDRVLHDGGVGEVGRQREDAALGQQPGGLGHQEVVGGANKDVAVRALPVERQRGGGRTR